MAILSVASQNPCSASPQKAAPQPSCATDKKMFARPRPRPRPLEDLLPGMTGEFMTSSVGKTPVSKKVYESSKTILDVAHVHKLPLRGFKESGLIDQRSRSNSATCLPSFAQQANSLSSLGGLAFAESRPQTGGIAFSLSRPQTGGSLVQEEATRPLSRQEVSQRNKHAADWFRATHAINYHSRPCGETTAMLAAARDRKKCPKVKKVDDNEEEVAPQTAPEVLIIEESPKLVRRRLDPLLLWGAKPVAKAKKEGQSKSAPLRKSHSMAEGVMVGKSGFLDLLRKRPKSIESDGTTAEQETL